MPACRHRSRSPLIGVGRQRDDRQVAGKLPGRAPARGFAGWPRSRPFPASGSPSAPGRSARCLERLHGLQAVFDRRDTRPDCAAESLRTNIRLTRLSSASKTRRPCSDVAVAGGRCASPAGRRGVGSSGRRQRNAEPERRALAGPAVHADLAAHQLHESLADRQSQPRAAVLAGRGRIGLGERLEEPVDAVGGNADAGVGDFEPDGGPAGLPLRAPTFTATSPRLGELHGVADQVDQHLPQPRVVAATRGRRLRRTWPKPQALLPGLEGHGGHGLFDHVPRSNSCSSSSILPASILEKSRMSLIRASSDRPLLWQASTKARCRSSSGCRGAIPSCRSRRSAAYATRGSCWPGIAPSPGWRPRRRRWPRPTRGWPAPAFARILPVPARPSCCAVMSRLTPMPPTGRRLLRAARSCWPRSRPRRRPCSGIPSPRKRAAAVPADWSAPRPGCSNYNPLMCLADSGVSTSS